MNEICGMSVWCCNSPMKKFSFLLQRLYDDHGDMNPVAQSRPQSNPYTQNQPRANLYGQSQGHSNPYYMHDNGKRF